jgi:type I restriction enzyme R subunit
VTFRDLERPTIDAITLFGDKNTKNVVLEKSYEEYMQGFSDAATGEAKRGFMSIVSELEQRFPDPASIDSEKEKKPSSNCLVNICGQKTSCKTTMNLPR